MRHVSDVADRELTWIQPSARKRDYELRAGEEVIITLHWEKGWGSLATAASGGGRWTLKRAGFWHPHVTVRVAGSETDSAVFRAAWTGSGTLELSPTRQLRWASANFWHSQWTWQQADGTPLVHFKAKAGLTKIQGGVDVEAAALTLPELDLLVPLGWYLLVLYHQDSAAVAASAGTAR